MAGPCAHHLLDGGLVGEEVAAVDGVVEVLEDVVALALEVLGGVDASLGADGVRALDGDDGEEVDLAAGFGDLDDGGEAGEAAAYYDDSWVLLPCDSSYLSMRYCRSLMSDEELRPRCQRWKSRSAREDNPDRSAAIACEIVSLCIRNSSDTCLSRHAAERRHLIRLRDLLRSH